eukprot:479262-Pleurochrysis_carterae.AAC.1
MRSGRGGVEIPPFKIENASSIDSLRTILDRAVGTHISHSFSVSEAVAVQISPLFLSAKDDQTKRAFAPHTGLSAVYIVLTSLYFNQRVQAPSTNALKRLANSVTGREGARGLWRRELEACPRLFVYLSISAGIIRKCRSFWQQRPSSSSCCVEML